MKLHLRLRALKPGEECFWDVRRPEIGSPTWRVKIASRQGRSTYIVTGLNDKYHYVAYRYELFPVEDSP